MAPGEPGRFDWIVCPKSNVNIANIGDWFTTFTAFESQLADGREVLGVGTIELEVKTHISAKINVLHRPIVLKDVLFVPSSICSILGRPAYDEYRAFFVKNATGLRYKTEGKFNEDTGMFEQLTPGTLWLVGYPGSEGTIDKAMLDNITTTWPKAEVDRWSISETKTARSMADHEAKKSEAAKHLDEVKKSDAMKKPGDAYNPAERAWLKRAFGGEKQFLTSRKLNVWSEASKTEGRAIARDLIAQEATDGYTLAEGAWLKRAFGSESQFLASRELNVFEDADRSEGRRIARGLIEDEAKDGS